jgi:hypothetical protein
MAGCCQAGDGPGIPAGDSADAFLFASEHAQYAASNSAVTSAMPTGTIENDQLAGALAEIEEASAALRRSEPLLEHRLPAPPARSNPRRYWSVWILIGGIWISATVVVATAAGAILYILG